MYKSRQLARLLALALFVFTLPLAAAAQDMGPRPFAPVQKGFTAEAEMTIPYAQDRLLVQLRTGVSAQAALGVPMERGAKVPDARTGLASLDALAQARGVTSVERPYVMPAVRTAGDVRERWFLYRFQTNADMAEVAAEFRADPNVEAVSLDWRAYPGAVPNDPIYPDQWGHDNTGQLSSYDWSTHTHTGPAVGTPGFDSHAQEAWDQSQGYGSSGVVIAIIDTGVDIDHPDLNLVAGYDYGDNDSNPDDNSASAGHGTACAGIAAAIANNGLGVAGMAGGCSIMPLKVANSAGSMFFSSIQNALYHAADFGADIASMSLSADITSDPATNSALQYAYNNGVLLLAATSNYNENHIRYPANNTYVMGIGAASPCGGRKRSASSPLYLNPGVDPDPNDYSCDGERWWGSNYGSTTPDANNAVDVIAPTILPTTDIGGSAGYASGDYSMWFNGTSCSTPYAAGVAALVKSANPGFGPAQLRDAIVSSATDVVNVESGAGWDRYSGYGMVNADAALGGGTPVAPTAEFAGTPTSGLAPLTVNFTDQSSGAPTSWSWNFGDGVGTSTQQNPSYTYTSAGTYTVSLTATNATGSDTNTKVDYITVTDQPVGNDMHVFDIVVTRENVGKGEKRGQAVVTIVDGANQPVSGATVTGDFSGVINEAGASGTTNGSGQVTLQTSGTVKGGGGDLCFAVTNVTHASFTYDAGANNVTESCEKAGDLAGAGGFVNLSSLQPLTFGLAQNQPNPFNPRTEISFSLPTESPVRLEVYNVAGRRVEVLAERVYPAGTHSVIWDGTAAASGVYYYRIITDGFSETKRMVLLK